MDGSNKLRDEESASTPKLHSKKRKRPILDTEELEIKIDALEPSSKKALRRARKGKAIVAVKAQLTSLRVESESEEEKPSKAAPLKRSEFGIWIGNLPWTATKANVRSFITTNTNVTDEAITRLHMPLPSESVAGTSGREKIKHQNKGFAYVDFATDSALIQALTLSEKLLQGRRVLIKDSKSFEGRPEKPKQDSVGAAATDSGKPPSRRIFVGNLAFDVSKEDLLDHFGHCGAVADVHMATFEDSGVCKGYAWVEFEDLQAGMSAVRGWVPYVEEKEESSSEEHEDEGEEEETEEGDEEAEEEEENVDVKSKDQPKNVKPAKKSKTKKPPKPRKWWVNRLKGRALRMEFAEDKTVRYNKRYGKDGTARNNHNNSTNDNSSGAAVLGEEEPVGGATPEQKTTTTTTIISTAVTPSKPQADPASPPPHTNTNKSPAPLKSKLNRTAARKTDARNDNIKPVAAASQSAAPRLMGGRVPSLGKKTSFK